MKMVIGCVFACLVLSPAPSMAANTSDLSNPQTTMTQEENVNDRKKRINKKRKRKCSKWAKKCYAG